MKSAKLAFPGAFLLFAVTLTGCGAGQWFGPTSTPTATFTPTRTGTPTHTPTPETIVKYQGQWEDSSRRATLSITRDTIDQFEMPMVLKFGGAFGLTCGYQVVLVEPVVIRSDQVVLKLRTTAEFTTFSVPDLELEFLSATSAAGHIDRITGTGLMCGDSMSIGTESTMGGPWELTMKKTG